MRHTPKYNLVYPRYNDPGTNAARSPYTFDFISAKGIGYGPRSGVSWPLARRFIAPVLNMILQTPGICSNRIFLPSRWRTSISSRRSFACGTGQRGEGGQLASSHVCIIGPRTRRQDRRRYVGWSKRLNRSADAFPGDHEAIQTANDLRYSYHLGCAFEVRCTCVEIIFMMGGIPPNHIARRTSRSVY